MTGNDTDAGSGTEESDAPQSAPAAGSTTGDDQDVAESTTDTESDASDVYTEQTGGTYIESTIIMTTVRVIAPFVMTFGLFVTLHGADSPGGGFQGGVVLAAVLVMIAFAYGTAPTRDWIDPNAIGGLVGGGVLLFAAIGLGSLALGESFLEYLAYGDTTVSKYSIELVELGIGATVVGVVTSIFFVLSRGYESAVDDGGET